MLASLDEIPGVRESRVDHSGRYFLLAVEPETNSAGIVERARTALADARRPDERVEADLIDGYRRGDRWMRAGETAQLSREEAHILAARHASDAAKSLGLDEGKAQKLSAVMDEETVAAFDRIHAAGGGLGPRAHQEFQDGARRVIERSRSFLSEAEVVHLSEYIARFMGDGAASH